jgi:hypothetical protein
MQNTTAAPAATIDQLRAETVRRNALLGGAA